MIEKDKKSNYQVLGIEENSSFSEVEKVYRQLYSQYHSPRGNSGPEVSEKFQEISNAYHELVKSEKGNRIRKKRDFEKKYTKRTHLQSELLETKRVVKVTKGGRRFSFTSLSLFKDEEQKKIAFSYRGGKEMISSFRKAGREGQKKLINYWSSPRRTIPHDTCVSYKATKILLKPTPPGSGIKAGGVLNTLFKYLEIKDISAKIIGSRNKLNVIRAAFLALDKLTGKKYDY
jgi:small subunit ribosomal protein S5